MRLFDFESAEKIEKTTQPLRERGDTVRALLDHRWLGFAFLIFLIAVLGEIQELLAMVAFMIVVLLTAWIWSRSSLRDLVYTRQFRYRRFFPGEAFDVQITIENRKLWPLPWLRVEDEWPVNIGPQNELALPRAVDDPDVGYLINTYSLRWYERIRRRYSLYARQRGVFQIGPAHLLSGDPFSLFDRKITHHHHHAVLIVYPTTKTLPELGLPLKDPFGDQRVQRRLFADPNRIMGVRDYSPQDSFRHIHWKATAHVGQLQTKVYEPTSSLRIILCLNVASFEQYWRGVWPAILEYEIEVAASLASWGLGQGHSVGLTANGTLAHADQPFRVPPSRRPDQLPRLLEALAALSYFYGTNYDRFLIEESPRLPWGATLILLTPFVNDAIAGAVLRLRDSGRRLVLIGLGKDAPPFIRGVLAYHLPIQEDEPAFEENIEPAADGSADLTPRQRYLLERTREKGRDHGE